MRKMILFLLAISLFAVCIILGALYFSPNGDYYKGKTSDHFDGVRFFDPELNHKKSFFKFVKWRLTRKGGAWPTEQLVPQYDIPPERVYGNEIRVSNVGHVTFLIQTQGLNILTDPVWSDRASPFSFAGPKRVVLPGIKLADLPPIDLIWVSHNHYDHLDVKTIELLWKTHRPRIVTPLGNDSIIKAYNNEIEVEAYDWNDSVTISDAVKLHVEATQHWSARGLRDHNKALWAALVIETPGGNIYFAGDAGYSNGRYFKKTQKKFNSFRLALIPIGAYEPRYIMQYAHMNPEEAVRAHIDLRAAYTVPMHYDVFQLSDEEHGAAIRDLTKAEKEISPQDISLQDTSLQDTSLFFGKIKVLDVGEAFTVPEIK